MRKNTTTQNIRKLYDEAKRLGCKAEATVSSASAYLNHEMRGFFTATDTALDGKELAFVKKLKKHVREIDFVTDELIDYTGGALLKARDVGYFGQCNKNMIRGKYSNVTEIDLTAAYFRAAELLGVVDCEILKDAEKTTKKARLVALGSLANASIKFKFDGIFEHETDTYNEQSASVFFACALMVDELLREYEKTGNVLFFWVDAVFIRREHAEETKRFFEERNFPCKEKQISTIFVASNPKYIVYRVFWEDETKTPPYRDFTFKLK